MSKNTNYVKGFYVKEIQTTNNPILKLTIKKETLLELAEKVNERGSIVLDITVRKEVGQYGDTHNCTINDWKPNSGMPSKQFEKKGYEPAPKFNKTEADLLKKLDVGVEVKEAANNDDLPF